MKKLIVLLAIAAVMLSATAVCGGEQRSITPEEWAAMKQDFASMPEGFTGPDPGREMDTGEREWHSSCRVCPQYPRCPSGYTQVGYDEIINMMYYQGWGSDNVGPGGFTYLISDTVVVDFVAEHDHIKASHCSRN